MKVNVGFFLRGGKKVGLKGILVEWDTERKNSSKNGEV